MKYVEDIIDRTTGKELGIQENDLWILSVAVQYNLVFVTNDRMIRAIEATRYSDRTEYWTGERGNVGDCEDSYEHKCC